MVTLNTIKEKEQKHYDAMARFENPIEEDFLLRRVVDRQFYYLHENFWKGKDVLDAACGEGRYLYYFSLCGARSVYGVDISLEYMRRGFKDAEVTVNDTRISREPSSDTSMFIQGDIEKLAYFKDTSLDTICIFLALHHLPHPEAFIQEVYRVLRPGGNFIVVDPNGSNPLRRLADYVGRKVKFMTEDEHSFSIGRIKVLLEKNKFGIGRCYSMNLFSELNYLCALIVSQKNKHMGKIILFLNHIWLFVDFILEKTVFRIIPQLGWRIMYIAQKA